MSGRHYAKQENSSSSSSSFNTFATSTPANRFRNVLVFWRLRSSALQSGGDSAESEERKPHRGSRFRRTFSFSDCRNAKQLPVAGIRPRKFGEQPPAQPEAATVNAAGAEDRQPTASIRSGGSGSRLKMFLSGSGGGNGSTSGTLSRRASSVGTSAGPPTALGSGGGGGTLNRPSPSPKCFGRNTHVLKEEYERDRLRWQQKLDEAEQRLTEASIHNSELFQIKAELNRKIIDFEKNQRPLVEQNRRLNERVRALNAELRKMEEKLSYAQDDFLSLRDAYDRLVKENSTLKEQRAFPEKLEELGRYRSQVLEYSKCITALRQSAIEKDRRYEMLVQKWRKYRRCLAKRAASSSGSSSSANTADSGVGGATTADDDRHSCIGSEGSVDSSSMCLDTIAEDLDEDVDLQSAMIDAAAELFSDAAAAGGGGGGGGVVIGGGGMTPAEYSLKQQLELANTTIVELQAAVAEHRESNPLNGMVERLQTQVHDLREAKKAAEAQLANTQHHNELLEFQLTELTEVAETPNQLRAATETADKQCATNLQSTSATDEPPLVVRKRVTVSAKEARAVADALARCLDESATSVLSADDRVAVRDGVEVIDAMQNQAAFAETELNMAGCELARVRRQFDVDMEELRRQLRAASASSDADADDDAAPRVSRKKKELMAEIEQLKREKKEEMKRAAKLADEHRTAMEERAKEVAEKLEQIRRLNGEIRALTSRVDEQSARIDADASTIGALRADFETLDGQLAEVRAQLAAVSAASSADGAAREAELCARFEREQRELEARFRASLEESVADAVAEQERLAADTRRCAERELCDARAQIATLRAQIRPIGNQLERRYEESRYRLAEALKKLDDTQQQLDAANQRIRCLESGGGAVADDHDDNGAPAPPAPPPTVTDDVELNRAKIQQLEAYNRQLEEQFNQQMDIIAALKKKFILLKSGAKSEHQSTDSIGWTSRSSSDPDEQYNSDDDMKTSANVVMTAAAPDQQHQHQQQQQQQQQQC